ncbi:MAG: bifunctional nuclease family protein [Bacteroidales bacterium]|nr:bifunctional nuclease family protein [Bacteroidales bacterium]
MNEDKVRLKVLGITYSQVQQGAYALVLEQVGGPYRIPVVVGVSEAQSIAVRLENIVPPRPMPHDIMVSMSHGFGISLDEVFIYKFDDGVFLSELRFSNDDRSIAIDSRTSDAIALSLRTGAPIYTTREILEQTGFIIPDEEIKKDEKTGEEEPAEIRLDKLAVVELEKMLAGCVEREEYERAAEIKAVIDRKRANK